MEFTEKRLKEAQVLAEKGRTELSREIIQGYHEEVKKRIKEAKDLEQPLKEKFLEKLDQNFDLNTRRFEIIGQDEKGTLKEDFLKLKRDLINKEIPQLEEEQKGEAPQDLQPEVIKPLLEPELKLEPEIINKTDLNLQPTTEIINPLIEAETKLEPTTTNLQPLPLPEPELKPVIPVALFIKAPKLNISVGEPLQFNCILKFSDETIKDITRACEWSLGGDPSGSIIGGLLTTFGRGGIIEVYAKYKTSDGQIFKASKTVRAFPPGPGE